MHYVHALVASVGIFRRAGRRIGLSHSVSLEEYTRIGHRKQNSVKNIKMFSRAHCDAAWTIVTALLRHEKDLYCFEKKFSVSFRITSWGVRGNET